MIYVESQRRAVFSGLDSSRGLLNWILSQQEAIARNIASYCVGGSKEGDIEEGQRLLRFLHRRSRRLPELVESFERMEMEAKAEIKIDVLEDPDLGLLCYDQGHLALPERDGRVGVYAFDTFRGILRFERVTSCKSVDQAIASYHDSNVINSTFIVAKGTENWPVGETALPLVGEQYRNLM